MDESTKVSPCKECKEGDEEASLQVEVEHLRRHVSERDTHIITLEGEFLRCTSRVTDLEEQLCHWKEKYDRLYDSHKRVQKLNQVLEDKLLQMVDKMKGDKSQLTKDIATLSVRLAESKHNVGLLQKENERYKNDMNLAIQLLQCKPDNFVSQKLDNLPVDTQARVSQYVMSKTKSSGSIPSKNGNENETFDTNDYEFNISASLMSKILEDSIHDTITKHCDTCTCDKAKNKPFAYDEKYYSVSTQTQPTEENINQQCINCNAKDKPTYSNKGSPPNNMTPLNEKVPVPSMASFMYPPAIQNLVDKTTLNQNIIVNNNFNNNNVTDKNNTKFEAKHLPAMNSDDIISRMDIAIKHLPKNINMEPGVHHKLCERLTRNSISSNKECEPVIRNATTEELLIKDSKVFKDSKCKSESNVNNEIGLRKNSHSSMGAISRTSSAAKSTSSTHKSNNNTQVGPGPRFCALRMQPGSKNILVDNAQPDVPPVLYKRQVKGTENSHFRDMNDVIDNFLDLERNHIDVDIKKDTTVIESTLIDVHVDSNNKDAVTSKNNSLNPVLMNVSSCPLEPLKTHSFSNGSEQNISIKNNGSQISASQNDNFLNCFNLQDESNANTENGSISVSKTTDVVKPENHDIQIFNFDRYEQNKITKQFAIRKIDMSNLHSLENTKISKDLSPQGECPLVTKKVNPVPKPSIPPIVNVYPNLTQTHLKVNDKLKTLTNDKSTSSLSSDDSAALLQKQQLLRVAEWVEQNLEQQNNLNDPLEEDSQFTKSNRRESKLRLADTLELALKMPHPVSKYSKAFTKDESNWVDNADVNHKIEKQVFDPKVLTVKSIMKETLFPAEVAASISDDVFQKDEVKITDGDVNNYNGELKSSVEKQITPEELARMEYNVKQFLMSGPLWENEEPVNRNRRTSSKTETDV